jgi:hypothetical protein
MIAVRAQQGAREESVAGLDVSGLIEGGPSPGSTEYPAH